MVRKVVAGLLVVAGIGTLVGALSDARAFGQAAVTGVGTNACCVRASTLPVTGGTCGILQGGAEGTKKDLFCDVSPTCPSTVITTTVVDGTILITNSLFADGTQTGGCVRQGLKVCSAGGNIAILVRRGTKQCASGLVKSTTTSQIGCVCVFNVQGASIINVPNCAGDRCQ